jgi:hypothetical protein
MTFLEYGCSFPGVGRWAAFVLLMGWAVGLLGSLLWRHPSRSLS